jgi:EmrB/QacA subfamily drug resistance transporter
MSHAERQRPTVTLAVLSLGAMAYSLLQSGVAPALPNIQHSLHASETGASWVFTAYLLSASVGTPILGRLGDMYGKEKWLLYTLAGLAVGTLLAAVASSLGMLIFARVVQGFGGGIFPLAFGIVRDEFPRERVPGAIGLLSALLGIGGGLGVVAAGVIVRSLDYHWLFWIPLVAILAAAVLTWRLVPESPIRVPGRVNWLAALLMGVGLSTALIAVSQTSRWGWGSPKTLGLIATGIAFLAGWVALELRSRDPLVDMRMMRLPGVWTTNLAAFLLGAGMFSSFILVPQFVETPTSSGFGFGASITGGGLFLLPATLMLLVVGGLAGKVAARFGSKRALVAGSAFAMTSFGLLVFLHAHPWNFYLSTALLGIGIGLAFAAMGNLIVEAVPPEQTGVATGMNTVLRTVGGALGAQIGATLIAGNVAHGHATEHGYSLAFLVSTLALALGILASLAVPDRPDRRGARRRGRGEDRGRAAARDPSPRPEMSPDVA